MNQQLTTDREIEIKACVQEVRNGLGITNTAPFVSLTSVYEELTARRVDGFNYEVHPDGDQEFPKNIEAFYFDGVIHLREKSWDSVHIYESNQYPDDRKKARIGQRSRFTLAHELGHFFLHKKHEKLLRKKVSRHEAAPSAEVIHLENLEKEADFFAGALLVSQAMLDKCHIDGWLHPSHLMRKCKISRSCANFTVNRYSEKIYSKYTRLQVYKHQLVKHTD